MKITETHVQSANLKRFTHLVHHREGSTKDGAWIRANVALDTKFNSALEWHSFSVTGTMRDSWGCIHNQVLEAFPQLQPLVNAHLACIYTGEPMHSIANGYYFMYGPRDSLNLDYAAKSFGCTMEELKDINDLITVSPNHLSNTRRTSPKPMTVFDFKSLEPYYISMLEAYLAPKWLATRDAALACYEEWLNS